MATTPNAEFDISLKVYTSARKKKGETVRTTKMVTIKFYKDIEQLFLKNGDNYVKPAIVGDRIYFTSYKSHVDGSYKLTDFKCLHVHTQGIVDSLSRFQGNYILEYDVKKNKYYIDYSNCSEVVYSSMKDQKTGIVIPNFNPGTSARKYGSKNSKQSKNSTEDSLVAEDKDSIADITHTENISDKKTEDVADKKTEYTADKPDVEVNKNIVNDWIVYLRLFAMLKSSIVNEPHANALVQAIEALNTAKDWTSIIALLEILSNTFSKNDINSKSIVNVLLMVCRENCL